MANSPFQFEFEWMNFVFCKKDVQLRPSIRTMVGLVKYVYMHCVCVCVCAYIKDGKQSSERLGHC